MRDAQQCRGAQVPFVADGARQSDTWCMAEGLAALEPQPVWMVEQRMGGLGHVVNAEILRIGEAPSAPRCCRMCQRSRSWASPISTTSSGPACSCRPPRRAPPSRNCMPHSLALPEVQQRLAKLSSDANPSTPEELLTLISDDLKRWGPVVKASGFSTEWPDRYRRTARWPGRAWMATPARRPCTPASHRLLHQQRPSLPPRGVSPMPASYSSRKGPATAPAAHRRGA